MRLQLGDLFCVKQKEQGILGDAIVAVSKRKSLDGECRFSHSGILISEVRTFEANWHYEQQRIEVYEGHEMLIGRLNNEELKKLGIVSDWSRGLKKYAHLLGRLYPWYRLPVFLMGIDRDVFFGKPVCSELCVSIAKEATGFEGFQRPIGWTPDNIADAIERWDIFDVIYDGVFSS